jgi:hypothetical protein
MFLSEQYWNQLPFFVHEGSPVLDAARRRGLDQSAA